MPHRELWGINLVLANITRECLEERIPQCNIIITCTLLKQTLSVSTAEEVPHAYASMLRISAKHAIRSLRKTKGKKSISPMATIKT